MSKYKVDTADGLSFNINSAELEKLDIIENQDGTFHLIYDNKSYNVELLESDHLNKNYILNINEKEISLSLKDELDMAIEKMGFSKKKSDVGGELLSPMPGLVIRMVVNVGDYVKKGDKLLILEAMKMENIIKATVDGQVHQIFVKEGETVSKKQLLIELK